MAIIDGCQMITSSIQDKVRMVDCTSWKETQDMVDYHVQMAGLLKAPNFFWLLDNPGACVGPQDISDMIQRVLGQLADTSTTQEKG